MKINWKELSKTKGYISLKKACLSHSMRYSSKKEMYRKFMWVICRAKHYVHKRNTTLENILNDWESKRGYSVVNYYQDARQPKIQSL